VRRTLGALGALLVLGCPARPPTTTTATSETPPDEPASNCGDADDRFVDAAALPADASMLALLDGDAAVLDAALARLEQHLRGGAAGLSVPTAFALGQWRWEVPLVRRSLALIGVTTGGLAAVQLAPVGAGVGPRVWAAPLACPVEQIIAALDGFEIQDTGGVVIATPRDRTRFAYDVVVRPDAVVLGPEGAARRVLAAWDRPLATAGGTTLRQHVFDLEPAAVRIAVRETGLLGLDAGASDAATHLVRIDGDGLDATLAP
jgi:hypothetical protein